MSIRLAPDMPLFIEAGGFEQAMQLPPPFTFDNVSIHAFPLRAKLHLLQKFCDDYVNIIPREAGYFHPFMPYVFMFVVNYGRMAMKEASLGWLSQNEIVFGIPVEWYVCKEGQLVLHDWGLLTPFIYIDNPLSITTGRMVYGWPKSLGTLTPEVSTWMDRPQDPMRLLSFSVPICLNNTPTKKQENKVIFEIFCDPIGERTKSSLSLIRKAPSLTRNLAGILLELGLSRKSPGSIPDTWAARLQRLGRKLNPYDPKVRFSTINLKQFRSSYDARASCYQGVTVAAMELRGINEIGRLDRDAFGDSSGGFRIHMHRYQLHPIIESLGLDVDEEWRGPDANVALIRPSFPFWVDMDLTYNLGKTIAWRTTKSCWVGPGGGRFYEPGKAQRDGHKKLPPYNSVSGTTRQIVGPFQMPNTTLRVLPLLADKEKLQQHCDRCLNRPLLGKEEHDGPLNEEERSFDVWGRYVYLVIANHKSMVSEKDNVGWWADRDVTFYVPVKWYERDGGRRRLRSLALVPFYSYANSQTAAITGAEVSGIPITMAEIKSGSSEWMDESGPSEDAPEEYVQVSAMMFQLFGEGAKAQGQVLLKVWDGLLYRYNDDIEWRRIAETWGRELISEVERKQTSAEGHPSEFSAARFFALQALDQQPINIVTFKQFRDCAEPHVACYQSLNLIRRYIEHVYDMREIENRVYVSIYSHQSQPIVETLGLVCATTHEGGAVVEYVLQPVRPFWMRVRMHEENAVVVQYRAGDMAWKEGLEAPRGKLRYYFEGMPESKAGAGDDGQLEPIKKLFDSELFPQRLSYQVSEWSKEYGEEAYSALMESLREAQRDAIDVIEPQMIIEPALSEEWENWGKPRWFCEQQERKKEIQKASESNKEKIVMEICKETRKPNFCVPKWTLGRFWNQLDPQDSWSYHGGDEYYYKKPK